MTGNMEIFYIITSEQSLFCMHALKSSFFYVFIKTEDFHRKYNLHSVYINIVYSCRKQAWHPPIDREIVLYGSFRTHLPHILFC